MKERAFMRGRPACLGRLLAGSALALPMAFAATPVFAQAATPSPAPSTTQNASATPDPTVRPAQQPEEEENVIIVSGLRADLDSALEQKRETGAVADFLPVADVGSLVTTDIAEALEFTPGIVGTRFRGTVENISLRGLPQLLTVSTVDGRVLSGRNGDRSVFFVMYPSELFKTAGVYKSTSADLTEGGIAGSVVLETPSPLSAKPGMLVSTRALFTPFRKNYTLGVDEVGGKISIQGQQKFDVGAGQLGIALGYNQLSDPTVTAGTFMVGFTQATVAGTQTVLPNGIWSSNEGETNKRSAVMGVLEYENASGLHIKLDGLASEFRNKNFKDILQVNNLNIPARYSNATFSGDNLQSAQLTNLQILSRYDDIYVTSRAKLVGLKATQELGAWTIGSDTYYSRTTNDQQIVRPVLQVTGNNTFLTLGEESIAFDNFNKDLTQPSNYGAFQYFRQQRDVDDKVYGTRLWIDREFSGALTKLSLGGAFTRRSIEALTTPYFDNSIRNASLFPNLAIGRLPATLFLDQPYLRFDVPNSTGTYISPFAVADRNALNGLMPVVDTLPVTDAILLASSIDNREDTWAGFVKADFETGRVEGSVGARLVNTKLTASGFTGNIGSTIVDGVRTITVNGLIPATETNSYTYLLPSLNVRYDFSPSLLGRLGIGRAISRPEFLDLRLSRNLLGGDENQFPLRGNAGNPGLNPIVSDQVDVALEWYPHKGTSVSLSGYYKSVDGFVTDQVVDEVIAGIDYQISKPVNTRKGSFYGLEAQVRFDFDFLPSPLDGFGLIANGSRNWTTIDPGYGILNDVDATGQFVYDAYNRNPGVQGFTPWTGSAILFYEKGGLAVRFAGRYASDRVRSVSSLNAPIVSFGRTYLDASASYRLNKHFTLQFQATNLTNTADTAYYVYRNYTAWSQQSGRSYFAGVDLRF